MDIFKKEFSKQLRPTIVEIKEFLKSDFGFNPSNHTDILCEKIYKNKDLDGDIIECGVWQGYSLFTAARFCELMRIGKKMIGFDTFTGFPGGYVTEFDLPAYFRNLLEEGLITKEHFERAAVRTKNFTDTSYLDKEHFLDVKEVRRRSKLFPNVVLIQGLFSDALPKYKGAISVLYIDCDLYQSYKDCLEILYEKVVPRGVIIFDEYYSLKYPGPRKAVNEFFADKTGVFEWYVTEEGFERWCFVKK